MPAAPTPSVPTFASPTDDLAAEYPERPETVAEPDDSIIIGSDSIDETTKLATGELQVLLGNMITENLSSVTPGTIDTNFAASFMMAPYASATGGADFPAWYQELVGDIVDYGFAGASLVSQAVSSVYIDGDNAENNFVTLRVPLYGHVNYPSTLADPRINDNPSLFYTSRFEGITITDRYRYPSPWTYDPREVYAMFQKYGFESWVPYSDTIASSVAEYHINREIMNVANLLATGFEERQNMRKVARRTDYRRNYEYIPESEQMESTSIVQQVVKTSIPTSAPLEIEPIAVAEDPPPFETISDSPGGSASSPSPITTELTAPPFEGDRY